METFDLPYEIITVTNELSSGAQQIIWESIEAMKWLSHPHISDYHVGAALRCHEGTDTERVHCGGNIETDVHSSTIHAEVGASINAIYTGAKKGDADTLAVSVRGEPYFPCGICRQFLYEKWGKDLLIYAVGVDEENDRLSIKQATLDEIFPHGFSISAE